jgi:hypothetical protein
MDVKISEENEGAAAYFNGCVEEVN